MNRTVVARTRATVDVATDVVDPNNGMAHEGLSTAVGDGDRHRWFDLDDRFGASMTGTTGVHVTFWDAGRPLRVRTASTTTPTVTLGGTPWRNARAHRLDVYQQQEHPT